MNNPSPGTSLIVSIMILAMLLINPPVAAAGGLVIFFGCLSLTIQDPQPLRIIALVCGFISLAAGAIFSYYGILIIDVGYY